MAQYSSVFRPLLSLVVFACLGLMLYGYGFNGFYFGDDLKFLSSNPDDQTFVYFFEAGVMSFFRPLEFAYLAGVQTAMGLTTWPIHLLNLLYHLGLCALIFALGQDLRLSLLQCWFGAMFSLISQVGPYAVAGLDTLSQVGGTFWGVFAVWVLYKAFHEPERLRVGPYLLSLAAFSAALLYKETSASFVLILPGLIALQVLFNHAGSWPHRIRRTILAALPFVVLFALYFLLRARAARIDAALADEQYAFAFGLNVLRNAAQFGLAAALPISTETVFVWLDTGRFLALSGALLAAFGVVALIGLGLWRAEKRGLSTLLLTASVLALLPALLLNHVSELYLYNALPFIALLVGQGLGALWASTRARWHPALGFVLIAVAVSHVFATRHKVRQMVANGARAQALLAELVPYVRSLPPESRLILRNPAPALTYSVFRLPGIEVLRYGESYIARATGRPDVEIVVGSPADLPVAEDRPGTTLVYKRGRLVPAASP